MRKLDRGRLGHRRHRRRRDRGASRGLFGHGARSKSGRRRATPTWRRGRGRRGAHGGRRVEAQRRPRRRQATGGRPPDHLDRPARSPGPRHRPGRATRDHARARRAGLRVLRVREPRDRPTRARRVQGRARTLRRRRAGHRASRQADPSSDRDPGRDRSGRRPQRPARRRADERRTPAPTARQQRRRRRSPQRRAAAHRPRGPGRLALGRARDDPCPGGHGDDHPRRQPRDKTPGRGDGTSREARLHPRAPGRCERVREHRARGRGRLSGSCSRSPRWACSRWPAGGSHGAVRRPPQAPPDALRATAAPDPASVTRPPRSVSVASSTRRCIWATERWKCQGKGVGNVRGQSQCSALAADRRRPDRGRAATAAP